MAELVNAANNVQKLPVKKGEEKKKGKQKRRWGEKKRQKGITEKEK